VTLAVALPVASAQEWQEIDTAHAPSARQSSWAVYDSHRGVVVLFGGWSSSLGHNSETWEYDGEDWTMIMTPHAPSPRRAHAMAYDSNRRVTVLFGGYDGARRNDTWEYDGTDWVRVFTPNSPPANWQHMMAFDEARGTSVVFGGLTSDPTDATWEYDGSDWVQVPTPTAPGPRKGAGMTWHAGHQVVWLFGGAKNVSASAVFDDTWEYDGSDWTKLEPLNHPTGRNALRIVYDDTAGHIVFFGGNEVGLVERDDTWVHRDADWEEIFPAEKPAPRRAHVFAFDSARGVGVLFGGRGDGSVFFNDTWEIMSDAPEPVPVPVRVTPRTLNKKSGGAYVKVRIRLGPFFSPADVDPSRPIELSIEASDPILDVGHTGDGDSLQVFFPRDEVQDMAPVGDSVTFFVRGWLLDGNPLEGTDYLRVIDKGKEHSSDEDPSSILGEAHRGWVENLGAAGSRDLGPTVPLSDFLSNYGLTRNPDPETPPPGRAFFYLLPSCTAESCDYGVTSTGEERTSSGS
jgi:hypothetical protein